MLYLFQTISGRRFLLDLRDMESIELYAELIAKQSNSDVRVSLDGKHFGNFYGRRVNGKFTVDGGKFILAKGE